MKRHFFYKEPLLVVRESDVSETNEDLHKVSRIMMTTSDGTVSSTLAPDRRWGCSICRPELEKSAVERVDSAFWDGVWVQVTDSSKGARKSAREKARRIGSDYVIVPFSNCLAVLTVDRIDASAEFVEWREQTDFLKTLMMRKTGNLSSSGFLAPSEAWKKSWEAHDPSTRDRCWHAHPIESEALACANRRLAESLGTDRWLVRRFSGKYALGSLGVLSSQKIRQLLDQNDIATVHQYDGQVLGQAEDEKGSRIDVIRLEPVEWENRSFRAFRNAALWRPPSPGDSWRPPPMLMRLTIRRGEISGYLEEGAA